MSSPGSDASVSRRNPLRAAAGATPWRVMTGYRRLEVMLRAPRNELNETERREVDTYRSRQSKRQANAAGAADRCDNSDLIANQTCSPDILQDTKSANTQAVGIHEVNGRGNNGALPNTSTPTRSQGLCNKALPEGREGEDWNINLGAPIAASTPDSPLANRAGAKPSEGHRLKNPRVSLPPLSLSDQPHKLTNKSGSTPIRPFASNDQLGTLSNNSDRLSGRLPASEGRLRKSTNKINFPSTSPLLSDDQLDMLLNKLDRLPGRLSASEGRLRKSSDKNNYPARRPITFDDQRAMLPSKSDRLSSRLLALEGRLFAPLDQAAPLSGHLLPLGDQSPALNKSDSGDLAEQAADTQEIPPQVGDIPVLVVDPESVLFYGGFIAFLWMVWSVWSM